MKEGEGGWKGGKGKEFEVCLGMRSFDLFKHQQHDILNKQASLAHKITNINLYTLIITSMDSSCVSVNSTCSHNQRHPMVSSWSKYESWSSIHLFLKAL